MNEHSTAGLHVAYRSRADDMRYFVPDICPAPEAPPEKTAKDKFGGIPFGFSRDRWPRCGDCGKSQSLLAQLNHDRIRLDLGRAGRVLLVYQCNHHPGMCATWDTGSGANACIIVEPEQLGHCLTEPPQDQPTVEHEVRVLGWIERDDGVPASLAPAFYASDRLDRLGDDIGRRVTWTTRLGGVPRWLQSPEDGPGPDWQFAGQFHSTHSFLRPPKLRHAWISEDRTRFEGRTHIGAGPNFGDGGIAYLFLHRGIVPRGCLLWQCG